MYPTLTALIESDTTEQYEYDEALEWLDQHAQPFLREVQGTTHPHMQIAVMFRGVSYSKRVPTWADHAVRPERKTKLMREVSVEMYNAAIMDAGLDAHRTNSLFTTGNSEAAQAHGVTHVVIPEGPFTYTWSPQIVDGNYHLFGRTKQAILDVQMSPDLSAMQTLHAMRAIESDPELILDGVTFKGDDGSLVEALASGCEIMVKPESGSVRVFNPRFFQRLITQYLKG